MAKLWSVILQDGLSSLGLQSQPEKLQAFLRQDPRVRIPGHQLQALGREPSLSISSFVQGRYQ